MTNQMNTTEQAAAGLATVQRDQANVPTFRLVASDFGYDDYDVGGCEIHRAKVSHRIKVNDIFNVYGPGSTKRGATWLGSIEKSVQAFLMECVEADQSEFLQPVKVQNSHDQASLADKAFSDFDFGEGVTVTDTGSWEYLDPGHERCRKVYVETDREDDGPAPRWTLNFNVRFNAVDGSLVEAYALDQNGQPWGCMPETEQKAEAKAYRVHLYAVVRVPVEISEASSQLEAIQKAESQTNLQTAFLSGEFADDVVSVLVDEVGDEEYLKSTTYLPDGKTGGWKPEHSCELDVDSQTNLQRASVLLVQIQQMKQLQDEVDVLLSTHAKLLMERITTASGDQIPLLNTEVSNFPNEGFYSSELRTALIKREIDLRSHTVANSSCTGL